MLEENLLTSIYNTNISKSERDHFPKQQIPCVSSSIHNIQLKPQMNAQDTLVKN